MALKLYREKATSEFWERVFSQRSMKDDYAGAADHYLAEVFLKYLPKKGKILEAGCGFGQWVYFLKNKGYDIEGIDYARHTIKRVKNEHPSLPVEYGNVLNIKKTDDYYTAIVSLGVFEHFEDGGKQAFAETRRILKKKGIFIITVRCSNPVLKVKKLFGSYSKGEFYQHAYSMREFKGILQQNGFSTIYCTFWDTFAGIKHEFIGEKADTIHKSVRGSSAQLHKMIRNAMELYPIKAIFGHMLVFVCRKT